MTLVFATHNPNKLKEVQALVPKSITLKSLTDIGCTEEIMEDATTIEGNAILKATYIRDHYGYSCFSDDTGLEVAALGGAPGVYSARYAGPQKDADDNMDKLLSALAGNRNRDAHFKTVIAFATPQTEEVLTFEGICKGEIITEKRGANGFGYDAIFLPKGNQQTFAEMSSETKSTISHRGLAITKFVDFLEPSNSSAIN